MKRCLTLASLVCAGTLAAQTAYTPDWESLDKRPVPQWWCDAKFGIFIHWGLYAVPAYAPTDAANVYAKYSEHYDNRMRHHNPAFTSFHARVYGPQVAYADFAARFRAEHFRPEQWAALFKKSGARYVVLTSKHHDGYALWPSDYSPRWNSQVLGPHRDLAGELSAAVKAAGLRMGFYYSLLEWGNPLYTKETIGRWAAEMNLPQMKELVTRYRPDIVWTDGEWDFTDAELRSPDFLAWLYNESPVRESVVVNDRWGKKLRSRHGGHYTTEYSHGSNEANEEQPVVHPWEECRGIGGSFGFNRFETTEHYMTSAQCVETLIEKVSRGGNLLLNIGPQADGLIPVIMEERLLDMGKWLTVNGEAIYGTTAWRHRPKDMGKNHIYFTQKPDALYVLCTRWPQQPITVSPVSGAAGVTMLGSDAPAAFTCAGDTLTFRPPALNPGTVPCEHAWVFKIALPR
ncbi:MAG: alpha-L-fucosidase [Kiritimatiellia bacterium]|jgi:alpha-L-fucosidase|nr:alpha-L-fucosidase [Kiritimatiellia bacterium]